MATAECHFSGGLNSSSGGKLKLYLGCTGSTPQQDQGSINQCNGDIYSPIHKASRFTVHGRSTGLPGTIPVQHKSVHWLSMGAAGRNDLLRSFSTAAGRTAALWIALLATAVKSLKILFFPKTTPTRLWVFWNHGNVVLALGTPFTLRHE